MLFILVFPCASSLHSVCLLLSGSKHASCRNTEPHSQNLLARAAGQGRGRERPGTHAAPHPLLLQPQLRAPQWRGEWTHQGQVVPY